MPFHAETILSISLTVQTGANSLPKAALSPTEARTLLGWAGPGAGVSEPLRSHLPAPQPLEPPIYQSWGPHLSNVSYTRPSILFPLPPTSSKGGKTDGVARARQRC